MDTVITIIVAIIGAVIGGIGGFSVGGGGGVVFSIIGTIIGAIIGAFVAFKIIDFVLVFFEFIDKLFHPDKYDFSSYTGGSGRNQKPPGIATTYSTCGNWDERCDTSRCLACGRYRSR